MNEYEKPTITEIASVQELTRGTLVGNESDNWSFTIFGRDVGFTAPFGGGS